MDAVSVRTILAPTDFSDGSHGRTGLAHAVLGSVAERVVQHAPCPVLTVKAPREPNHPVRHIPR